MAKFHFNSSNVCLVTGAAGGMGDAICKVLLARGCIVIGTDVNAGRFDALAKENQGLAGSCRYQLLDVTDASAVTALLEAVYREFGRLDCVINNAGIMSSGEFYEADLDIWRKVMDVNLMGVVYGSHAAYRIMKAQGFGRIVNLSSTAGITPVLKSTAYAASKHAVVGFTNSLRGEAKAYGIDVQLVVPGLIDTGIFDAALDEGNNNSRTMSDSTPIKKLPVSAAAQMIVSGIEKDKAEIVFPFINRVLIRAYRLFPQLISKLIMSNQKH